MPFTIRPYRRFPLCCPMTYHAGLSENHGTIWNVSLTGWRFSGDLPLRVGQSFPMTVMLSDRQSIFIAAGIIRWKRDKEYGVETLVADDATLDRVGHYVRDQIRAEHQDTAASRKLVGRVFIE